MALNTILAKQVYKSTQGNDIWAYVMVEPAPPHSDSSQQHGTTDEELQLLLHQYVDVFQEPTDLLKALVWFWLIDETLSANLVHQGDYEIGSTTPSGEENEDHNMTMVIPWR